MKTAVIYARYSCDNQTEQSIEGQLRVCEEYAQRNNIVILNTYIDRAMTGTNDNRPDFQKMLKDSYKKEWNYVLVYKLDRFSRDKYASVIHKRTLKNNGIKLLSAMENIPDTPEGIILESLLEGMNQYYSAELSQKVKRGMKDLRLKGQFQGGYVLFGYEKKDKKLVIHERNAEVVRYIFKQYSLGYSAREIAEDLNAKGILTNQNKKFVDNNMRVILRNEKYIGKYVSYGETYYNMYPRIVDDELFEKVQEMLKANTYGGNSVREHYLLKHKVICGYCGQPISAESGKSRCGKIIKYYKCLGRKEHKNNCQKETIRKELLEQNIIEIIINELSKPKVLNSFVDNILKVQNNLENFDSNLTQLEKSKVQFQTMLNNLLTAVENGIVNKTTNSRMEELETKIEEIDKQITKEKSLIKMQLNREDILRYYKNALKQEPRKLISYLVKQIKLFDDKIEITFNTPLNKNSDESQGSFFLSTTKYFEKIRKSKYSSLNIQVNFYI